MSQSFTCLAIVRYATGIDGYMPELKLAWAHWHTGHTRWTCKRSKVGNLRREAVQQHDSAAYGQLTWQSRIIIALVSLLSMCSLRAAIKQNMGSHASRGREGRPHTLDHDEHIAILGSAQTECGAEYQLVAILALYFRGRVCHSKAAAAPWHSLIYFLRKLCEHLDTMLPTVCQQCRSQVRLRVLDMIYDTRGLRGTRALVKCRNPNRLRSTFGAILSTPGCKPHQGIKPHRFRGLKDPNCCPGQSEFLMPFTAHPLHPIPWAPAAPCRARAVASLSGVVPFAVARTHVVVMHFSTPGKGQGQSRMLSMQRLGGVARSVPDNVVSGTLAYGWSVLTEQRTLTRYTSKLCVCLLAA